MLDAYVIEEIKRRERERQRHERSRPVLEVPDSDQDDREDRHGERDDAPSPGTVVQIEL